MAEGCAGGSRREFWCRHDHDRRLGEVAVCDGAIPGGGDTGAAVTAAEVVRRAAEAALLGAAAREYRLEATAAASRVSSGALLRGEGAGVSADAALAARDRLRVGHGVGDGAGGGLQ